MFCLETKGKVSYDGTTDHDIKAFLTVEYLQIKYREYNSRFFNNELPTIRIEIKPLNEIDSGENGEPYGITHWVMFNKKSGVHITKRTPAKDFKVGDIVMEPLYIRIAKVPWADRFQMENCLVHEMCHLFAVQSQLDNDWILCLYDRVFDKTGHGPAFQMVANSCINNKYSEIPEGFKVLPNITGDELEKANNTIKEFIERYYHVVCCLERHIRVPLETRRFLEQKGYHIVENSIVRRKRRCQH